MILRSICFWIVTGWPFSVSQAEGVAHPAPEKNVKWVAGIQDGSAVQFQNTNLPVVVIETHGETIRDGIKIDAEMGIIDNGPGNRNALTDPFNDYVGSIGIEIRGQSSAGWPKKQWGFETRNDDGSNRNVSLLGLPPENDWILNAPFIDRTMIRNALIFRLSREMGRYASRSRFCEVVLNGEYQGVYVLLEKIKRDTFRVDIATLQPEENTGDALTGGYIIKVDKTGNDYFVSQYPPYPGLRHRVTYQYHYPKDDEITDAQKNYIRDWMYEFENVMASDSFADPNTGYAKSISVGSFVDHFILNELAKNVDGFRLSAFMYKDKDSKGGKLHAGPIWDFNLGFGNANYYGADVPEGWELINFLTSGDSFIPPFWWYVLAENSTFLHRVYQRWIELRQDVLDIPRIHGLIDAWADTLSEAVERNFELWPGPGEPGTGFWPVPEYFYTFMTYADEIHFLKDWIEARIVWMDAELANFAEAEGSQIVERPERFHLYPNSPNPFNGETVIHYDLKQDADVCLVVFDLTGREIRTLTQGRQSEGSFQVRWDGSSDSGRPVSSGMYIAQLTDGKGADAVKMILIR